MSLPWPDQRHQHVTVTVHCTGLSDWSESQGHESLQPDQTVALQAMSTSRISDSGSPGHHAREERPGQLGYMREQGLGRSFTITACRGKRPGRQGEDGGGRNSLQPGLLGGGETRGMP